MRRAVIAALLLMIMLLTGCGNKESEYADIPNPTATITLEDGREMRFELHLQQAPNTVANFVSLANAGFYDGLTFYRVLPGCLVQTGDAAGDGTGGPGYSIKGEFAKNGVENGLSHVRGTISMARQEDYDSAGSQFFIMQGSFPEYDGQYAAFGRICDQESLDVLDSITNVHVDVHQRPLEPTVIDKIRVDTNGYEYTPVVIKKEDKDGE